MTRATPMVLALIVAVACDDGGALAPGGDAAPGPDAPPEEEARGTVDIEEARWLTGGEDPGTDHARIRVTMLDTPMDSRHDLVARVGHCQLLRHEPGECGPSCPGICVHPDRCVIYPPLASAGTLTISGLRQPVTLTPESSGAYYDLGQHPADLFADDATVTLTAAGAAVPAFTITTGGVPPLAPAITDGKITLAPGKDHTLRWSPAAAGARVRVTLNANNEGHGLPYLGIIECDVPDEAGQVVIDRTLVDGFPETDAWQVCAGADCPPSVILRYRQGTAVVPGGHVRLRVGSVRYFGVVHRVADGG
jgi:hypothetical protein